MNEDKKPQSGEWWQNIAGKGPIHRIYVIGENSRGELLFEDVDGNIEKVSDQWWHNWHHVPDCTGWDWEPEKFPQWYVSGRLGWENVAYVVRDTPTTYFCVDENGDATGDESYAWRQGVVERGAWKQVTREEAEARVTKPAPPKNRTVILKEWLYWDDAEPERVFVHWCSTSPANETETYARWDHAHETGNTRTIEVPL